MKFVDVADLAWTGGASACACRICGNGRGNTEVFRVPLPGGAPGDIFSGHRCAACQSMSFTPDALHAYDQTFADNDDLFWRHYLEVGAGIYEMIWPVAVVAGPRGRALLEVGCGFGFTIDFWRKQTGGVAVGVETAAYGQMGAKALGVQIHPAYLQDVAELRGTRFDLISGSEVIEHVPDPAAFLGVLRSHLKPGGVLVLTTPNAAFVAPGSDPSVVLAAVSAGFHAYLLSAAAFESMLRAAGFAHVTVRPLNERLIAWASDRPIVLQEDQQEARRAYLQYLSDLFRQLPADSALSDGIAFRVLKENVNLGQWDLARAAAAQLEGRVGEVWGQAALEPEQVLAVSETLREFDDIGRSFPYFLPMFFFYRGVLAREADPARALRYFNGAFAVGRCWTALASAPQLDTQAHIWSAHAQQIATLLATGWADGASRLIHRMFEQRAQHSRAYGYAMPPRAMLEATLLQGFFDCLNQGRVKEAGTLLPPAHTLLREHYGAAAAGQTPAAMPGPHRVWFHYYAGKYEALRTGDESAGLAQLALAAGVFQALPEGERQQPAMAQLGELFARLALPLPA